MSPSGLTSGTLSGLGGCRVFTLSKTNSQKKQKMIKKTSQNRFQNHQKSIKNRSKIGPWSGPESLLSSWSHRDPPRTLLERTGRPSWTLLGQILGPTWAQLEPTWSQLGPISRQLGANLGSSWAQVASRKPSWAILRPSRDLSRHVKQEIPTFCLLYTSPSPRDGLLSRMPSSA